MTSSPGDPLTVLATAAVSSSVKPEEEISNGVIETPVRENAKSKIQPSSSRPLREAKWNAIKNMRDQLVDETIGENEMRNIRRSTPKRTNPRRKTGAQTTTPRRRKSATWTSKRKEVAIRTPKIVEKHSQATPVWAKESASDRSEEAESAGFRLKMKNTDDSPESLPRVVALKSDSIEAQVPVMDNQQKQNERSESPLEPGVGPGYHERLISFMIDQQHDERPESPENAAVESRSPEAQEFVANDQQQDERSESPKDAASHDAQVPTVGGHRQAESPESPQDAAAEPYSPDAQVPTMDACRQDDSLESPQDAAIKSYSPDAQVPAMDGHWQDKSPESPQDAAVETYSTDAQVPAVDDHWQDERPESPEDAKSCSSEAQVTAVNGRHVRATEVALPDTGLYKPKRPWLMVPLASNQIRQQQSQTSMASSEEEVASLHPSPRQRQETPQKMAVSDEDVIMEYAGMDERKPAAKEVPVLEEGRSPDQVPQVVSPPPDEYYVEETAWRNFNPPLPTKGEDIPGAMASEDLQPLPPAPPIPELPDTGKCRWSFSEDSRVLLADFVQDDGAVQLIYKDEEFLLKMMERDDISVVSNGLATGLNPKLWTLEYIADAVGDEYYHKFRAFEKEVVKPETPEEKRKLTPSTAAAEPSGNQMGENVSTGPTEKGPAERPPTNGQREETSELTQANGSVNVAEELSERFYTVKYRETDQCLSMKIVDFVRYMGMRRSALRRMQDGQSGSVVEETDSPGEEEDMFKFIDHISVEHVFDVTRVVLYMIDFDLVKLLPKLYEELLNKFELPGCLPGGIHCMMNAVNINGRPFMGPNLYCTPPESFTQCHQDGHGTVDSGHLCLAGFNEVVMIRRLPQRHKMHALALLKGKGVRLRYDGLYDLPHGDDLGEKPGWPDLDAIEACRRMNYYPSTFILRPGQLVHINKGRLHAFRKLSPSPLPISDCHVTLRSQLLATSNVVNPDGFFCFSVAWDWMYRGITSEGIYREVLATLECAILNRLHNRQSLAIPELSLLQMARTLTPAGDSQSMNPTSLLGFPVDKRKISYSGVMPSTEEVLRGILPALRCVVDQHTTAVGRAVSKKSGRAKNDPRVSLSKRPNSHENPQAFALDPYGNSDFFCKLCSKELSNAYMHCDGCEILLTKDFNICVDCWDSQKYKEKIQMHPLNKKKHSTINHTGNMSYDRHSHCPCRNGPVCLHCKFCAGCSCKCHQWFTLHRRFFTAEDEKSLVRRVEAVVGESQIPYSDEVAPRLEAAARPIASSSPDQESTIASRSSTKRPASEDRNESGTSKKRKKGEATSGPPAAPIKTSGRNRMREHAPSKVPPAAVKAKAARKKVSRSPADNDSGIENFDVNQRPDELRAVVCSPTEPLSRDDLSDGALAFTEPRGRFPSLRRGGNIVGFDDGHKQLRDFMEKARALDVRTPSSIRNMLPEKEALTEDHVRHLFRNFADCGEIRGKKVVQNASTCYSRRELDIFLYGHFKKLTLSQCHALMPYRPQSNLSGFWNELNVWSRKLTHCAPYIERLEKTVGLLFSLEEGNSAWDESRGLARSDELNVTEDSAERFEDRRTSSQRGRGAGTVRSLVDNPKVESIPEGVIEF